MIRKVLLATGFIIGSAFAAAAGPAPNPPNPNEDCDEIMEELKDLADDVAKLKANARTPMATCAVNGQLLGVAKASRAAAAECYPEGKKVTDLLAALDKTTKDLEGAVASCR
jgi:hypothetical protein